MRITLGSSLLLAAAFLVPACGSSTDEAAVQQHPEAGASGSAGFAGSAGSAGSAGAAGAGAAGDAGLAGASGFGGQHDAGIDAQEAGADAADGEAGVDVPLEGMGDIYGQCGVLDDAEWNASAPFLFRNSIDFGTEGFVEAELSTDGAEVLADGNLNPGSIHSEVVAFEALYRCELADLIKTEAEVDYQDPTGKKTDILVWIDGRKVGVSVTRAYHYPPSEPYPVAEATTLLNSKLSDIPLSAANAESHDAWERSMLHVIAYDAVSADAIETAWDGLGDLVRADTILVVTVTDGNDEFIY